MAGNTEQKIKNLQFKRNKTIYSSLEELVKAIKEPAFLQKAEIVEMRDGELIMFRYMDENSKPATLMGTIYNPDTATKEIHLEISPAEVKKLVKQGVEANGKIKVSTSDKVLEIDSDGALSSTLSISREGNLIKLLGKKNTLIGSFTLPTEPSSGATTAAVSLNYKPDQAILQLIKDDDGSVISEIDFPFETMVQTSELTSDNKLKLVFNTTNGTQEVIVDINKLKDIYTSGDSTILVSGNKVSTKVSSKTSTFPITKVSDGLWIDDTSFKSQIENITNRVVNLESKKYTSGDNTIVVNDTQISTKVSAKPTSLPITKETDGLWVNDAKLTETINDLKSLKTKVNNLETGSGSSPGGTASNEPKNPTGVNLLFENTEDVYGGVVLEILNEEKECVMPLKPITLNQAEQVFTFSFDIGDTTTEMSGLLGIALVDEDDQTIPLTIFSEGNLDVQETWSNDEDPGHQGVYLNLTKIGDNSLSENSTYSKLRRLFISFGFKDSNAHTVKKLVLYTNEEPSEFFIGAILDPILEFGTIPSEYSIKRHEYEFDKRDTKNILTAVNNRVKDIETSIKEDVVTETNTAALDAAANSISDSSVLRFYHTGDDTNLDVVVPKETPFLEYWNDGQSTFLSIDKYNSQGKKEKIVGIVTEQDLNSVTNRVKDIENNPVSSGDSTIEVINNKVSTKISSIKSKLPLIKNDDGLWVDDSDYNSTMINVDKRINKIETSIKDGLIPNLGKENDDIIEVTVGFKGGSLIKKLVLGAGLKEPYNFVISHNGGSYDPEYNISTGKQSRCTRANKTFYSLIESMDYSEWLHNCNIDPNNFNNNPDSLISIKDCYVPTSLSISNDSKLEHHLMLFEVINQFCNYFAYNTYGNIWEYNGNRLPLWTSEAGSIAGDTYTYIISHEISVFLDSTLFFNKSMQGKYFPFMWNNKLWYFHFNAVYN